MSDGHPKRVLDLFCGGGGASMGLHRAWPDAEIVGVDIQPQPHYPFRFVQADAVTFPTEGFDFGWASPPCQHYSWASARWRNSGEREYPDLIDPTRDRLVKAGIPFVIENVMGARRRLKNPFTLCGSMFQLGVQRHRLFETNFFVLVPSHPSCNLNDADLVSVTGHGPLGRWYRKCTVAGHGGDGPHYGIQVWKDAMQIDWMSRDELTQAIPPAYSEFIARSFKPCHAE